MKSFRSIQRGRRNGTAGNTSFGGAGYSFCERHRKRYPNRQFCPVCMPDQKTYRPTGTR